VNPADPAIAADEANERAAAARVTADQLMVELLPWAASYADVPVSRFRVGAVVRGGSGALYAGANLELSELPLAATVHAEQSAVHNAWLHGETALVALAVTAVPCGHCRQFLNELPRAAELRIFVADRKPVSLGALLPQSFGPADLGVAAGLLASRPPSLAVDPRSDSPLAREALAAASASYAPYTGAYAGLALRLQAGGVVAGRYAESAAYNPSLPALQAALSALALARGARSAIAEAVLVEADGRTSQRTAAEAALRQIANLPLTYLRADTFPGKNGS
jgi:cytidine deaminase